MVRVDAGGGSLELGSSMKRLVGLLVPIMLSACVAANGTLAAQLENYHLRNVSELSAALGEPSAETSVDAEEVYVWGDPRLALLPQMSNGGGESVNQNAGQPECTIRVFVGPDQRIRSWDLLGSDASCRPYADRLSASH